ncbi:Tex-like protein [Gemmatirosa kalamazoonensis]|uniref:Tex-like protein n=1 Tax=Gemmatirosa kalamazoonensis TaxID=861299 RepID=W0RKF4_9BACT|nr:Tex family protein [Gemmatirosa kalamazoonensis]AHG91231.1 Tex-like protein [Gemmatirosa kalamazoonensis]
MTSLRLVDQIARELSLNARPVAAALALFAEGNTLPFIARYRKEATGGLDEVQLRDVRDRAEYLEELEARRAAVLKSIEEQGKLTDDLRARIDAVDTKQALEDLYLPFKPKRRTRAMIARERGLEPLADRLWSGDVDDATAEREAATFVDAAKEVPAASDALQGARDILAERAAEDATLRGTVRELTRARGVVRCAVVAGKGEEVSKFQDYYDFSQKLGDLPSHRVLAIRRGEEEGFLTWQIDAPVDDVMGAMRRHVVGDRRASKQLELVAQDAYKRLLAPSITVELRLELKARADEEAIRIFGRNLEELLLAAPAGERVVIGLDPGFRTGVKVAVLSRTGAVIDTDAWYLHQPDRFAEQLARAVARHRPELIAIGNGTASRETEKLAREVLAGLTGDVTPPRVVVVNESGASVYSACDVARDELPDLDVSLRGAVSIARRLQDPLAELVKIDPKSIGVGQYQHDVNQTQLKKRLDEIVESCVNRVGVEVNTASPALLSYVAGIGPTLAQNVVRTRDERGGFRSRRELADVPRLGAKAFEQSAGFLRVRGGAHPLDASAVHPERYALVERMAADLGTPLGDLVGNDALVDRIEPTRYLSDEVGLPTLRDILSELKKPGRDPRDAFELPAFRDDVREPKDLVPGMRLEGVVTNVVAFGAFVDVGVHQDGLVHVSQLADQYVSDPNRVVRVGQKVAVTVVSVDLARSRIALTMKRQAAAAAAPRPKKETGFVPRSGAVAPNGMRFR